MKQEFFPETKRLVVLWDEMEKISSLNGSLLEELRESLEDLILIKFASEFERHILDIFSCRPFVKTSFLRNLRKSLLSSLFEDPIKLMKEEIFYEWRRISKCAERKMKIEFGDRFNIASMIDFKPFFKKRHMIAHSYSSEENAFDRYLFNMKDFKLHLKFADYLFQCMWENCYGKTSPSER